MLVLTVKIIFVEVTPLTNSGKTKGLFLKGPKIFWHLERHNKISNLMNTELFY